MRLMVTAVEFVNTVGGRTHSTPVRYVVDRERMHSIGDLFEWAARTEIVTAAERRRLLEAARSQPRAAAALFERALRFREALYRIFKAVIDARRPDTGDLDLLNRELRNARAHERLRTRDGRLALDWHERDSLDFPLHVVARSAADLLTSERSSRLKQCGGESCGWLFIDTTRNRSRQWCDMRDCGNLAKVRRFRERRKAALDE